MSEPVILRLVRPYSSVEEYLDAEASTILRHGMVLLDVDPLPEDTLVRFVVSLQTGEPLIKAEGRTRAMVPPGGGRPGGLRVRFKRFGATTKAFIDRAVAHHAGAQAAEAVEEDSSPNAAPVTERELSAPNAAPAPLSAPESSTATQPEMLAGLERATTGRRETVATANPEPAATASPEHLETVAQIAEPPNRNALLDELRQRARQMTEAQIARYTARTP